MARLTRAHKAYKQLHEKQIFFRLYYKYILQFQNIHIYPEINLLHSMTLSQNILKYLLLNNMNLLFVTALTPGAIPIMFRSSGDGPFLI